MLSAFTNSFKIPELRQKIFFTLALLFVARVGAQIPLPGLNPLPLQNFFADQSSQGSGLVGLYNMFTGGAFLKGAVFGLGIMPYISASIIMQLMSAVFPFLAKLQQEGEHGRMKVAQYTRYLTILICLVQAFLLVMALTYYPSKLFPGYDAITYGSIVLTAPTGFILSSTLYLTCGTLLLMWLGEQITQKGIGNGISLLITIGIVSDLPGSLAQAYSMFVKPLGATGAQLGITQLVLMLILLFVVIAGMVAVTQAQRKISVQYAKRVVGRKVMGGQTTFLPLKVNYSGVMPVIFASALLLFPQQIFTYLGAVSGVSFFQKLAYMLNRGSIAYYTLFGVLILGFSYFWVSIMFKPIQIAEDIKKNGGYIPGVKPGLPTAQFLDFVMTRLTLAGSIFLTAIALFPDLLANAYHVPYSIALFFGGTGTLITVGVILDTMKQVETLLIQRHYDGFLNKGSSRSRSKLSTSALTVNDVKSLSTLWVPLGSLLLIGILAWFFQRILM